MLAPDFQSEASSIHKHMQARVSRFHLLTVEFFAIPSPANSPEPLPAQKDLLWNRADGHDHLVVSHQRRTIHCNPRLRSVSTDCGHRAVE